MGLHAKALQRRAQELLALLDEEQVIEPLDVDTVENDEGEVESIIVENWGEYSLQEEADNLMAGLEEPVWKTLQRQAHQKSTEAQNLREASRAAWRSQTGKTES